MGTLQDLPNDTKIVLFLVVIGTAAYSLWGWVGLKSFAPWPTEGPKITRR